MAKRNAKTIFMLVSVTGMLTATAQAQTPVERGRYLVEGILTCGNCHSPRGPGGVIDTAKRSGRLGQIDQVREQRGHDNFETGMTCFLQN